jgi:predicted HTH domain antitoxin
MESTWTINLPKELELVLKAAGYNTERITHEAKCYLAAGLFSKKILSIGQAAQLAEMSLWDFIPFLGEQGIPVADYDKEEAEKEVESVKKWMKKN